MDTRLTRTIIAQFYAAKGLQLNPLKSIKFMIVNKEYFPYATDEWLDAIKKEKNITDEQLEKVKVTEFASFYEEIREHEKMKERAKDIHEKRKEDHKKRDFGHGIKNRHENNFTNNLYESVERNLESDKESDNDKKQE